MAAPPRVKAFSLVAEDVCPRITACFDVPVCVTVIVREVGSDTAATVFGTEDDDQVAFDAAAKVRKTGGVVRIENGEVIDIHDPVKGGPQ